MREYQPFAISNFRVGFDESVEPWLLPRDAYQVMVNAHLYRGVLEKISGYNLFARMSYRTEISLGTPDGVTTTFTGTLAKIPTTDNLFAYGTIIAGSTAEIFGYSGDTAPDILNLTGSAGGTGTINLTTGAYSITFNTAPPSGTYSSIFLVYDSAPNAYTAIMGIQQYYSSLNTQQVMVFDQKRVGIIVPLVGIESNIQGADNGISEIPHDFYQSGVFAGNAVTTIFSGVLTAKLIAPGTVVFTQHTATGAFVSTIMDNGKGVLSGTNVVSGSINYVTGAYTITFSPAPANGNVFDSTSGVYGDIFTGTISNFFTLTNYQYKAFFTNGVNPIWYYDGVGLHYLITNLEVRLTTASAGVPVLDITTTLHVFTNRERLLLISPTVEAQIQVSAVYWSEAGNPLNFTNDEQLFASTSEPIRTYGFINSDLVLRFANSERVFRYTGDAFSPFRFDSTNNVFPCDAPYSSINYDTWFSAVSRVAITGSDALNVKRADDQIPDFTDPGRIAQQVPVPFMSQSSIEQCYGERFDDLKEGWLCYNSSPSGQGGAVASDNVLAFNYLDSTYAVYQFPLSCLGFGTVSTGTTWSEMEDIWENTEETWISYLLQLNALTDLGGDQYGRVQELNTGSQCTNVAGNQIPVLMNVISKNLNPFIEQGELARFGYVDLLVSAYATTTLRVQFYVNDNLYVDAHGNPAGYYKEVILNFKPTDAMSPVQQQTKVWKRIYVGAVAKIHTIRFYQNILDFGEDVVDDQPVYIHAMVVYMKPAGRIFN